MSEKVILSKEIAELITALRTEDCETGEVYKLVMEKYAVKADYIMSALVNGYEAEQTPEVKVREFYRDNVAGRNMDYNDGICYAIKKTLDILGIKIEGVND